MHAYAVFSRHWQTDRSGVEGSLVLAVQSVVVDGQGGEATLDTDDLAGVVGRVTFDICVTSASNFGGQEGDTAGEGQREGQGGGHGYED